MNEIVIGQILMVLGFIWIGKHCIKDVIHHQRLIEENAKIIGGKTKKRKEYIFFNEEETEEETAFGVPIDMLEEEN